MPLNNAQMAVIRRHASTGDPYWQKVLVQEEQFLVDAENRWRSQGWASCLRCPQHCQLTREQRELGESRELFCIFMRLPGQLAWIDWVDRYVGHY